MPDLIRHPPSFSLSDMEKTPIVYMLAKGFRSTLYTGVTSDLLARIYQHRTELTGGFTARYGVKRLIWF
jgi:putative endonuclease